MADEVRKKKRKSGLPTKKWEDPFEQELSDLSEFIDPYLDFSKDIGNILYIVKKRILPKCYTVKYKNAPDLFFITFQDNRYKAKGAATKFFRDNMHPLFIEGQWRHQHIYARAKKFPAFDKYAEEGKVPILELMRIGLTFPCSICGEGNFDFNSNKYKQCFIVEGEGDLNPFTKGFCICKNCYEKHYKND